MHRTGLGARTGATSDGGEGGVESPWPTARLHLTQRRARRHGLYDFLLRFVGRWRRRPARVPRHRRSALYGLARGIALLASAVSAPPSLDATFVLFLTSLSYVFSLSLSCQLCMIP